MEEKFRVLEDNGQEPRKCCYLLLDTLVRGPNHVFNKYVQRIIDDVESSTGYNALIKASQIVIDTRSKYINMSVQKIVE